MTPKAVDENQENSSSKDLQHQISDALSPIRDVPVETTPEEASIKEAPPKEVLTKASSEGAPRLNEQPVERPSAEKSHGGGSKRKHSPEGNTSSEKSTKRSFTGNGGHR